MLLCKFLRQYINVGGKLTLTVEKDATLKGAVVKADTIDATIKGNLSIASVQDKAHSASSSVNGSGSVNIGFIGPSSVSLSGGGARGSSDVAWVSEQSGFFGKDKVDVYVEKHTQLDGAVIASEKGKDHVTLDTGTLGFSDIQDHDKGTSTSVQVGVTLSEKTPDGQTPKTDAQGHLVGGSVSGAYETHDVEQVTRATVEGTVKIRDKDKQQQDVATLNRDADQAQVIVKDVRAGTKVYVSDTAIKSAAEGIKVVGRALGTVLQDITSQLGSKGQISPEAAERVGSVFKGLDAKNISLEQVVGCTAQTGFNLHDLLFPRAYAASGCNFTGKDGTSYTIASEEERTLCLRIIVQGLRAKTESGEGAGFWVSSVSKLADVIRTGDQKYGVGDRSVTETVEAWGEFKHELARGAIQAKFGNDALAEFDAFMIPIASGVSEIKEGLNEYIADWGKSKGLSNKEISDLKYVAGTVFVAMQAVVGAKPGKLGGPLWSEGKVGKYANAKDHFEKHGTEFGATSPTDYVLKAHSFLHDPPAGTLTRTRANGEVVMYNPATNTFGILDINGAPKSFYKPAPVSPTNTRGYDPNKYSSPLDYFKNSY